MISFTYFTSYTNLDSNQKIKSQCPSSPQLPPFKIFSLLGLVKLFLLNVKTSLLYYNGILGGIFTHQKISALSHMLFHPTISSHKVFPLLRSSIFLQSHKTVEGVKHFNKFCLSSAKEKHVDYIWLWVLLKIKPEQNTLEKYQKNEDLSYK